MDQVQIFRMLNAGPGLHGVGLALAQAAASYAILAAPVGIGIAWRFGTRRQRRLLVCAVLACVLALVLCALIEWAWPQPRPIDLHVGNQYLSNVLDAGMPSDQVAVFWTLAFVALAGRSYAVLGFPLLTLGLALGWDRVYLGVQFPLDVAAALPVAALAATLGLLLGPALDRTFSAPPKAHPKQRGRPPASQDTHR